MLFGNELRLMLAGRLESASMNEGIASFWSGAVSWSWFNDLIPTIKIGIILLSPCALFWPSSVFPPASPSEAAGCAAEPPVVRLGSLTAEPKRNILKKSSEAGFRSPFSVDPSRFLSCPRCEARRPLRNACKKPSKVPSSPSTAFATLRKSLMA